MSSERVVSLRQVVLQVVLCPCRLRLKEQLEQLCHLSASAELGLSVQLAEPLVFLQQREA